MATPYWPWHSDGYTEALSKHRKKLPNTSRYTPPSKARNLPKSSSLTVSTISHITPRLDSLLAHIDETSPKHKYVPGYTIQVYIGNSRNCAFKIKKELYARYLNVKVDVKYNQPNYIVQVGKFFDRLEAYVGYTTLKRKFGHASIRPATFLNTRGLFCEQMPTKR